MPGEAGFVKLDATEELLRREEWVEVEMIACDLVTLFTAAGVTLASVNALDYPAGCRKSRSDGGHDPVHSRVRYRGRSGAAV